MSRILYAPAAKPPIPSVLHTLLTSREHALKASGVTHDAPRIGYVRSSEFTSARTFPDAAGSTHSANAAVISFCMCLSSLVMSGRQGERVVAIAPPALRKRSRCARSASRAMRPCYASSLSSPIRPSTSGGRKVEPPGIEAPSNDFLHVNCGGPAQNRYSMVVTVSECSTWTM